MKNRRRNYAYIGEMRRRSWLKAITWRLIGIIVLGTITWLVTGNWEQASLITISFHAIRLVLYYFHERGWDNVEWGRTRVKEQVDHGEGIQAQDSKT